MPAHSAAPEQVHVLTALNNKINTYICTMKTILITLLAIFVFLIILSRFIIYLLKFKHSFLKRVMPRYIWHIERLHEIYTKKEERLASLKK